MHRDGWRGAISCRARRKEPKVGTTVAGLGDLGTVKFLHGVLESPSRQNQECPAAFYSVSTRRLLILSKLQATCIDSC